MTINCHKEISDFHRIHVNLPQSEQREMRERRDNGRIRLNNGLQRAGHATPTEYSAQGSYAMRTMVQDSACDYDIDDGAYFLAQDLQHDSGDSLSPYEARMRVRDALKDDRLAYDAEIKTNCVRQKYPTGYHIDIPVYRVTSGETIFGNETIEYHHASGDSWLLSDARAVTRWYNDAISQELQVGDSDYSQTRRMTRLTKMMSRSRIAWKGQTTSGICISKLVIDNAVCISDRDDLSLYQTWKGIKAQLDASLMIRHPVKDGQYLSDWNDTGVAFFHQCLSDALDTLAILDREQCTNDDALKAWDSVFNTNHFANQAKKRSSDSLLRTETAASGLTFPDKAVIPNKPSGFAQ